jgi:hypothetical protein
MVMDIQDWYDDVGENKISYLPDEIYEDLNRTDDEWSAYEQLAGQYLYERVEKPKRELIW